MKTTFEVHSRQPFADGRGFGATGSYERIDGWITFAVDPSHAANAAIVDLAKVAPGDDGSVRFGADLVVVRPTDPRAARGRVLVEAVNRGRRLTPQILNRAGPPDPHDPGVPAGDGFLFRHGFSVVFLGWQWDVIRDGVLMGLDAPRARTADGSDLRGRTVVEIRPNELERTRLLANRLHRPLPVADLEERDALLTVRDWEDDEPRVVPRDRWAFAREGEAEMVPSRDHVTLLDGFEPGRQYHVVYTASESPVAGCGLLALRDVATFLRSEDETNPLAGATRRVYAFGMSQSGRLLRHFVYLGLNRSPSGQQAYDGLIPHVAGGRRGEFNHRFAQPSVQLTPGFGHRFPFADDLLDDSVGEGSDGLLVRQRQHGAVPRIITINSAAEYWRGDASLVHTDPAGTRDLEVPENARVYAIASTQHGPGAVPQVDSNPNDGGRGRYGFNTIDFTPIVRAALIHLDHWVEDDTAPPPSVVPRLDDGTATARSVVLDRFARFGQVHVPDPDRLPLLRTVTLGPDADAGIARHPVEEGAAYPAYVSAVNADGNEIGGIQLPDVTVPLATHTGWNPRHPATGGGDQIMPMQGFSWYFPATAVEREADDDPRRSIHERYRDREDYLRRVELAGEALARDGYVLPEDLEVLVADAADRWDDAWSGRHQLLGPRDRG